MKYQVIVAFLFSLSSSIANAETFQSNKPVICDTSPEKIIKSLIENYKEKPVWTAKGEGSNVTLFVNKTTNTWTMLQYTSEWACIIGAGGDSEFYFGESV